MRLSRLACWLVVAGIMALSPSAGSQTSTAPHAARKALGPAPNHVGGNTPIFESSNWAGYAVVGTGFTRARGTWIVPAVDCSVVPTSSASFWVGIDGWDNATVEQTGTDSDCNDGVAAYYAWYEFAPQPGVTIVSVPVSPGDHMLGEVIFSKSEFIVTTTNVTTGASYTTSGAVPEAKRTSAEWIAEFNGNLLSDFGNVEFGPDFTRTPGNEAADSTTSGPIGAFGNRVQASIMVAGKKADEAVPSFMSTDGTSFTVSWWRK